MKELQNLQSQNELQMKRFGSGSKDEDIEEYCRPGVNRYHP